MFYACGRQGSFLSQLQFFCWRFFLQAPQQLRFIMNVVSQNMLYKHNRGILCQHFTLSHDAAVQNTDILITYCNEGERMLAHQKCCKNVGFFKFATLNYGPRLNTLQLLLVHGGTGPASATTWRLSAGTQKCAVGDGKSWWKNAKERDACGEALTEGWVLLMQTTKQSEGNDQTVLRRGFKQKGNLLQKGRGT